MEIFHWKCCSKRLENPISIVLSNSRIVRECCPWYRNILETLWKYSANKTVEEVQKVPWYLKLKSVRKAIGHEFEWAVLAHGTK